MILELKLHAAKYYQTSSSKKLKVIEIDNVLINIA